jgi:hypothetical protein
MQEMTLKARVALAGITLLLTGAGQATQAQAQESTGRIVGRVVDAGSAQGLSNAQVAIEETGSVTITDLDGRYRFLGVPAGRYRVRVQLLGYAPKVIEGVVVTAGGTQVVETSLDVTAIEVAAITVEAIAERGNTARLLEERRQAPLVQDALGATQIDDSPDGDAAAAVRRVPGMTVVDGKYVYVRGLGERYSNTTLNGSVMPSSEPDRKSAALDLIPSDLIETVVTAKTYSADKPGDYAGGLLQIETRQFPATRILKFDVGSAFSTTATGADGLGYQGGDLDFWGIDDGTRDLPTIVPPDVAVSRSNFSTAELRELGLAFTGQDWGPTSSTLPADVGFGFAYGDAFDVGGAPLGVLASYTHGVDRLNTDRQVERVFAASGLAEAEVDYLGTASKREVSSGGLLDVGYLLARTSKLRASLLYNRVSDDESRILEGFNLDSNTDQRNTRLRYVERSTTSASLRGEHLLTGLGDVRVRWTGAYTATGRYEPNTREVLYRQAPTGEFLFDTFIQSGSVFHQDLDDTGLSGSVDVEIPVELFAGPGQVSLGAAIDDRDRDVYSRRLRYLPAPGAVIDAEVRAREPNDLFTEETVGPQGFELREATFREDNYAGTYSVLAGYGMARVQVLSRLSVEAGLRVEQAEQTVTPVDLFPTSLPPVAGAALDDTDLLPALNLTYLLGADMNLRFGASQTVARPQLRELAPFSFADFAGGYLAVGNPTLVRSRIRNLDVRWEWFVSPGSVISVSGFYKRFDDPIETVVFPSSELIQSWVNVPSARNFGTELEVRSGLGVVASWLADFSLNANLTLVDSEVSSGGELSVYIPGQGPATLVLAEKTRALQGQSPYAANVGLTWASDALGLRTSALFNAFGRRISSIGTDLLEDVYEEGRAGLDLVVEKRLPWNLAARFAATRLVGDTEVEFTQFGDVLRSYETGRKFALSMSWSPAGGF